LSSPLIAKKGCFCRFFSYGQFVTIDDIGRCQRDKSLSLPGKLWAAFFIEPDTWNAPQACFLAYKLGRSSFIAQVWS
jgi:hypothetical protein